jgi:hypothetical protein
VSAEHQDDLDTPEAGERAPELTLDGHAAAAGPHGAILVEPTGATVMARRYPDREPEGILAVDFIHLADVPPIGWGP